jgi:beta-phosphoglucomutase-like phosphatase (HAD superfamily)
VSGSSDGLRAVVFDFDGVLVDSEPLHFRTLHEALATEGVRIDEAEYAATLLAHDDRAAIRIALEQRGIPWQAERVDSVALRKARLFGERLPDVRLFPGARALVEALAGELPLAIASGARHGEIEAILGAVGLRDAFAIVVGADDVTRTKPHPEPYAAAVAGLRAREAGLATAECLAIEDSPPGILSARDAGLRVLGVGHTYPTARLGAAHQVVESLLGLDARVLRALHGAAAGPAGGS